MSSTNRIGRAWDPSIDGTASPPLGRGRNPAALVPLVAALLVAALGPSMAQAGPLGVQQLDPDQVMRGENLLVTSIPGTFTGANVGTLIGADRFYQAGIYGQNSVAANVEAGQVWNGHETLTQVTNYVADPTTFHSPGNPGPEFDRHATWVGMTIGGRNGGSIQGPWQTGIAPRTDLRSGAIATQFFSGGAFAITPRTLTTAYGAFFGTADVVNSSWGSGGSTTGTDITAQITDGLASRNPRTTFVVAAGNAGPAPNTVLSPANGYNKIAVAALQNNGANVYNTVATFSSRGPVDYFDPVNGTVTGVRAAVDIAAPGTDLTSAFYGGQTGGNNPTLPGSFPSGTPNSYTSSLAGTSLAAPITAGAVALLNSASRNDRRLAGNPDSRDARVMKAVLQNSADKIPGWDNGQHLVGKVIQTTQSLDWASGAGALNLNRAYDQYITAGTRDVSGQEGGKVANRGWDFGTVEMHKTNTYLIKNVLQGGSLFTATLDWFRDRAYDVNTLTTQDIAQANLELIIRDVVSGVVAESISVYNDVEHLSFLLPSTSRYAIDVYYKDNIFGDIATEQYGLAWNAVSARVPEPGTLVLLLSAGGIMTMVRRRKSAVGIKA